MSLFFTTLLHQTTTDLRQLLQELRLAKIDPHTKRGIKNHLVKLRDEIDGIIQLLGNS